MENHDAIVIIISFMNKMFKRKCFASNYQGVHLYFSKYKKNPFAFLMLILYDSQYCSSNSQTQKEAQRFYPSPNAGIV